MPPAMPNTPEMNEARTMVEPITASEAAVMKIAFAESPLATASRRSKRSSPIQGDGIAESSVRPHGRPRFCCKNWVPASTGTNGVRVDGMPLRLRRTRERAVDHVDRVLEPVDRDERAKARPLL